MLGLEKGEKYTRQEVWNLVTAGKTTSDKIHHYVFKNGHLLGVLSAFVDEPSLVLIANATCEKFD